MINQAKAYKVVIVGAGPGGAILARQLAAQGILVELYEKGSYEQLGHNWSDAVEFDALKATGLKMPCLEGIEWVGELVKDNIDAPGIFEKHAVPILQLHSPGLKSHKNVRFKMITTDRRRLGKLLVDQAVAAGAHIYYGYEGKRLLFRETGKSGPAGVEISGVLVKDSESGLEKPIEADLIVESSGFQSVLRSSLPLSTGIADCFMNGDYALVHREVRKYEPVLNGDYAMPDYYRYGFHTGYQWSHIHNEKSIDIGAGVKNDPDNPDPADLVEDFISRHPAVKTEKLRGGRSLCIVGRPLCSLVSNGFLVIGDAASMSVPTTGCGVGSALLTALWAADTITEAAKVRRNDLEILWMINTKFFRQSKRGASFAALSSLREILQTLTHDELDYLFIRNLLDAKTLQNAVNGEFDPPGLPKKIESFLAGIANLNLLLKLNAAVSRATRVYKHYLNYPQRWDEHKYQCWKETADQLGVS